MKKKCEELEREKREEKVTDRQTGQKQPSEREKKAIESNRH